LKELTPVRLIKNEFYNRVQDAYKRAASKEDLQALLGRGRAKRGIFEGDLVEGELEIGQVSAMIHDIIPAAEIVERMMVECNAILLRLGKMMIE
jgi:enoyl-[acyl-carrier protein] reductase II